MKFTLVSSSVRKCRFENAMVEGQQAKFPISLKLELRVPKQVKDRAHFLIISHFSVGNPVEKFEFSMDEMCNFLAEDISSSLLSDKEELQKVYMQFCSQATVRHLQETLNTLTSVCHISPILLPTVKTNEAKQEGDAVDMTGVEN